MTMGEALAKIFTVDRLNSPEVVRNPYPYYDELRGAAPLFGYRDFPPGTVPGVDQPEPSWVVLSHADVSRVAFDHEAFSSRDGLQEQSSAPTLMLVNHDRPEHTRLRKIAAKAFSPAAVQALGPAVRELVRDTMAGFFDSRPEGTPVDVMADYCALLPARVIALVMGVPQSRDRDIRRWATAFMLSADLSAEERQRCNTEVWEFYTGHVRAQIEARARGERSPGDLLNSFIETEVDGERLDEDEIIRFCVTATVAGAETTSFLLGNLFAVLADEPAVWPALQADRGKFTAVYEETLRFHGPPQRLFRVATRDVEIGHAKIRRGDWVACFFGAANYDASVFPEPYRFRLDRPNGNQHMSFGHGIHRCLGAPLARLEAEMTVLELLDRYTALKRAGTLRWQGVSLLNHGPESNPIAFHRKAP
ncbi:cytochrome P450 [Zavarzinia aquatilis]|uniref:cytochrome P450 n=1 Tax=Zavarzinia aquatilis TaxID=2211142 RepID=UPI001402CCF6|nr:cytochrome P450 [Zavarzinia aquatilis]